MWHTVLQRQASRHHTTTHHHIHHHTSHNIHHGTLPNMHPSVSTILGCHERYLINHHDHHHQTRCQYFQCSPQCSTIILCSRTPNSQLVQRVWMVDNQQLLALASEVIIITLLIFVVSLSSPSLSPLLQCRKILSLTTFVCKNWRQRCNIDEEMYQRSFDDGSSQYSMAGKIWIAWSYRHISLTLTYLNFIVSYFSSRVKQ